MSDKSGGSVHDPQNIDGKGKRSVLDKAINAVAEAFKNGSAETTMAHWPDLGAEPANGGVPSDKQDGGGGNRDEETVTYTFEPVVKLKKNGKDKKNKKKNKKEKKKQKKLEKKLAEKLKKIEKKERKKLKKEAKKGVSQSGDQSEHGFNEAGPYGPGGI